MTCLLKWEPGATLPMHIAPVGVTDLPMPATPERVWRALRARAQA